MFEYKKTFQPFILKSLRVEKSSNDLPHEKFKLKKNMSELQIVNMNYDCIKTGMINIKNKNYYPYTFVLILTIL